MAVRAAGLAAAFLAIGAGLALPVAAQEQALDFDRYRQVFSPRTVGISGGPSLAAAWAMHYRGAALHAAFAYAALPDGRTVWRFVSGQPSPDHARRVAQEACDRAAAALQPGLACRLAAVDGQVVNPPPGTPAIPPRTDAIGPFRAAPLLYRGGPGQAHGVVIWSHGYSGPGQDARGGPVPGFVSALNDAGWDVMRFDRDPLEDTLAMALPRLLRGLPALRDAGYRRILLAGHSRGAWQSILAATQAPDLVDAVIAVAPAAHGETGRENNQAVAMPDFRRALASLPAGRPRLAVLLFDGDPFDPDPAARAAAVEEAAAARAAPTLVIWPSGGPRGHGGAGDWRFTQRHSACLLTFVQAPPAGAPRGLRRESCGGG